VQPIWGNVLSSTFDLAVIGHFSLDLIRLPCVAKPFRVLGGAVAYVSFISKRLGVDSLIISKVGADFPKEYMKRLADEGLVTSGIIASSSDSTTSFELTYNMDLSSRVLKLRQRGSIIERVELPRNLGAKIIHIAPIAGEVPFDVVEQLRSCCEYLSVDPQGMVRLFDENGKVGCGSNQVDARLLPLVDIYKSSQEEIQTLTGHSDLKKALSAIHDLGPRIVIATMGSSGSVLSTECDFYRIPACKPKCLVDPTGAGDVFIGAFLAEYLRHKKDPRWCACVGSAAASLVVEDIGTNYFGNSEEINRRAESIYEKK
jgi:sugar/nucleoside kinase (ribokinase family)